MKNILLIVCVCISLAAQSQETSFLEIPTGPTAFASKSYSDSTGNYLIKYEYNSGWVTIPATYPPGEPHYYSKVMVYKILGKDTVIIGKPFSGVYVKEGCWEDTRQGNIAKAKKIQSEMKKE